MFASSSFAHDDITLPTQSEPHQLRIQTGLKTITKTKTKKKNNKKEKQPLTFCRSSYLGYISLPAPSEKAR